MDSPITGHILYGIAILCFLAAVNVFPITIVCMALISLKCWWLILLGPCACGSGIVLKVASRKYL